MPRADSVLFMLAGVLGLWGLSLVLRGLWRDRASGRQRCPACTRDLEADARRCLACGFEGPRGRDFRDPVRHWGMVVGGAAAAILSPAAFLAGLGIRRWAYTGGRFDFAREAGPWAAVSVGVISFGLAVLVRALYGQGPRGRRRCPACWYEMEGVPALTCPECGYDAGELENLYRRRRRPRLAWAGGFLVAFGIASLAVPMVRRDGWVTLVPNAGLIAGLEYLPDRPLGTGRAWRPENTLVTRDRNSRLRGWERDWLRSKCLEIVRTTNDRDQLQRATLFALDEAGACDILLTRALAGLGAHSAEDRAASAQLFSGYFWSALEPGTETRARARSACEMLSRAAADEDPVIAEGAILMLRWADSDPEGLALQLLELADGEAGFQAGAAAHSLLFVAARHENVRRMLLARLDAETSRDRLVPFLGLGGLGIPFTALSHLDRCAVAPAGTDAGAVRSAGVILNWLEAIGMQGTFPALDDEAVRTPVLRAARGIRHDLLGPHVVLLVRALGSAQAQVRADAASNVQRIAETTSLDLAVCRPALEALAVDPTTIDGSAASAALKAFADREHQKPGD